MDRAQTLSLRRLLLAAAIATAAAIAALFAGADEPGPWFRGGRDQIAPIRWDRPIALAPVLSARR